MDNRRSHRYNERFLMQRDGMLKEGPLMYDHDSNSIYSHLQNNNTAQHMKHENIVIVKVGYLKNTARKRIKNRRNRNESMRNRLIGFDIHKQLMAVDRPQRKRAFT